jgi:hypothetical protein
MGLRILRGAKPSDIPQSGQGTILNLFDWREPKRWGISEDRLPPESIVRFKKPAFGEVYRGYIIAAILLVVFGYGFISLLLVQRKRLRQQFRFEQMLSNLSARFVNLPPDQVGTQIDRELEMIGSSLEVDRVSVLEISENTQRLITAHSYTNTDIKGVPEQIDFSRLTLSRQKIFNGEMVIFSHPDELPPKPRRKKTTSTLKASNQQLQYPLCRWFLMLVSRFGERKGGVIISRSGITKRKLAEIDLRDAYTEIEHLKNQLEAETAYQHFSG